MHILVIGGTAFMGPHLVKNLVDQGHQVTVFHRGKSVADLPEGVRALHGNRFAWADHADDLRALKPDVVVDMVLITEQQAREVMETFRGVAQRVVAASSCDVYAAYGRLLGQEEGEPEQGLLTEQSAVRSKLYPYRGETARAADDPAKIMDDYDKILVEQAIMRDAELAGTVIRLPAVFGPRDRQHRFYSYIKRMQDGRSTILLEENFADWRFGYGYVENMGWGLALAALDERAAGNIYNLSDLAGVWTQRELVQEIATVLDWQGDIVTLPAEKLPEKLRPGENLDHHMATDSSKIRQALGYEERVKTAVAIEKTVQWESDNPPPQLNPDDYDYALEDQVLAAV